ncbi:MAG: 4Fe-4S dicluster domain-containing protein, partial [Chloroflexota bacterium]|nr:4Fe-4S dicluster domain-containing protein [Chloroflexota bacterium]
MSYTATEDTDLAAWQRELLGGEYGNMLSCVRCGQCLTSCPTYVLTGHEGEGPRGRVAMMRMLQDGRIALTPDLIEHEQNCLVCDACTAVCPAGVHMDPLQVALRTAIAPNVPRSWPERLVRHLTFRYLFWDMRLFRGFVFLLRLYQRSRLQALARGLGLLKLLGLKETEAFLPPVDWPFLVPRGEVYRAKRDAPRDGSDGTVAQAFE